VQYITQSRNTRNRLDAAKELKKLVFFSNIVVAPLLDDLKVGMLVGCWLLSVGRCVVRGGVGCRRQYCGDAPAGEGSGEEAERQQK